MNSTIFYIALGAIIGTAIVAIIQYIIHKKRIKKIKERLGFDHDRFNKHPWE